MTCEAMSGFSLDDLVTVFGKLQEAGWDAILVGGQAVNVWANQFQRDSASWSALQPYTSRDLDYHGGLAEARRAMQILGARGKLNTSMEPSPNAGLLTVSLPDGQVLLVDILTGVFGLSAAEVERTAVRLSGIGPLAGLTLRVIHPLLLLECKAASLRGLNQSDRQDAKHLRILILVIHEWLTEQLSQPRSVFRSIERLGACALSPDGLQAFVNGIDVLQAIPLDAMREQADFATFLQQRWPQLQERINDKRRRHLEAIQESVP